MISDARQSKRTLCQLVRAGVCDVCHKESANCPNPVNECEAKKMDLKSKNLLEVKLETDVERSAVSCTLLVHYLQASSMQPSAVTVMPTCIRVIGTNTWFAGCLLGSYSRLYTGKFRFQWPLLIV